MKPGYYTIVKLSPNTNAGDSVSIGLIIEAGEIRFAQFSRPKIELVTRLRGFGSQSIKDMVKKIEQFYSADIDQSVEKLIQEERIDVTYFQNLHASSVNFLQFSDPKPITVESENECLKLYHLFVDDHERLSSGLPRRRSEITRRMKNELFPKIKNNVTINQKITPSQLPRIDKPFKFDGLGKNGKLLTITGFDIDSNPDSLYSHYQRYETVRHYLMEATELSGTEFLVMDEPSGSNKETFLFFDRLLKLKSDSVIAPGNFEKIINFVHSYEVKKFDLDELLKTVCRD